MAVRPKKYIPRQKKEVDHSLVASDLLKTDKSNNADFNDARQSFVEWCAQNGKGMSRRQARTFLQKHPHYRNIQLDTESK